MENPTSSRERRNRAGIDDNILAMLDASEAKDAHQDALDDGIAFLDAVRASSIVLEHGKSPTSKIFGAVFHMLRAGKSLELIMASYKLLVDLDKHFPRVYLSGTDDSPSSSNSTSKLVVVKEAWSPIVVCLDNATAVGEAGDRKSGAPLDPSSFQLLIEELAKIFTETEFQATSMKPLRNMLLFQYLVIVLEGDFLPRNATMYWSTQRESLLNMLLGSRKINYKSLMKDCMAVICQLPLLLQNELSTYQELRKNSESLLSKNCHTALSLAILEVMKNTCVSMEKLLVMIMDLDMSRKKADIDGHTSRADGPRTPLMDIILDELAYSKDTVPLFLKIFSEPKWKLEIVVQYLWKYITKPSVRTRKSDGCTEDATFDGALKCFSNKTGTKSILKKIGADVVQLLLAHGFQAQLSILSEGHVDDNIAGDKEGEVSALVALCQTFISTFDSLRSTDEEMEISSLGKEALFTAATIISMKS
ncbi:negative regulator of systemic acquired resistance SNI1 [Gastrolobium bilobum]|uniref:negative regulator of systemic acquired resistance SNI1 n=1 Tax=Gastrolobium bilobum TaxID=150636 RepID=UPI002AB1887C|nr:negative regulator of systemic acquired resistance SNI1 [Gastrolobium bilobum]